MISSPWGLWSRANSLINPNFKKQFTFSGSVLSGIVGLVYGNNGSNFGSEKPWLYTLTQS